MTKISTTATNQLEHTEGCLLDIQRERKRETNKHKTNLTEKHHNFIRLPPQFST